MVFDSVADAAEFARIIRSYCVRVSASEIRMASCGAHVWARLVAPLRSSLGLCCCALLSTLLSFQCARGSRRLFLRSKVRRLFRR